jgi:hypothetical protein
MSSARISQLPSLGAITDSSIIPVVEGGVTKSITGAVLKAYTITTAANLAGGSSGSIPYQTSTGTTGFVNIGGVNTVLTSDGNTVAWTSLSGVNAGASTNADNVQINSLTAGDRYFALADSVNGSYVGLESTTVNKFNNSTGFTIGSTATFTMSTPATSTATGALVVSGGVGVGGTLQAAVIVSRVAQDFVTNVTANSATTTLDLSLGNVFYVTVSANTTFAFSNVPSGTNLTNFSIITYNNAGGYAVSWPAAVTWAGGQTPTRTTTSGKSDAYTFFTLNAGTTIIGSLSIQGY